MNQIGGKIATLREGRGLTQAQLAIKLSISKQRLSNYERGTRNVPLPLLAKIASICGVDLNYFSDDERQDVNLESLNAMEFAVHSKTKDFSADEWADLNAQADLIIARRNRK